MRHDIKHHIIGSPHRIGTNARKIVDALIHIIIHDTLGRSDTLTLHGKECRKQGGAHTRRNLQGAAWLGTVADHTGKVCHHVLDRVADTSKITTHQIGDTATATRAGYHATAESREFTQALLDIDSR